MIVSNLHINVNQYFKWCAPLERRVSVTLSYLARRLASRSSSKSAADKLPLVDVSNRSKPGKTPQTHRILKQKIQEIQKTDKKLLQSRTW